MAMMAQNENTSNLPGLVTVPPPPVKSDVNNDVNRKISSTTATSALDINKKASSQSVGSRTSGHGGGSSNTAFKNLRKKRASLGGVVNANFSQNSSNSNGAVTSSSSNDEISLLLECSDISLEGGMAFRTPWLDSLFEED